MTPASIACRDGANFLLTVDGHTVTIPVTKPEILARILLARNDREMRAKIGSSIANPVQDMVDAWLSSNEADVRIRRREEAARDKYGSLFDEIEI